MRTGIVLRRPRGGRPRLVHRAQLAGGYTISEVMIFLAVSTALFVLVASQINGQQTKSDFTQTARNFESRIQDLANDVSTGYYNNNNNFSCTASPGTTPSINPPVAGQTQGSNTGCILVGQLIRMAPDSPTFDIVPLAGTQKTNAGGQIREVQDIFEANPVAIDPASVTETIGYGAIIKKITYNIGAFPLPAFGVALITTFGLQGGGGLASGDVNVNLVPLSSPVLAVSLALSPLILALPNGMAVTICLQDNATSPDHHADVVLSGKGRQLYTKLDIFNNSGACS